MPMYKGKYPGYMLFKYLTHFSCIVKCTPKVGHKELKTVIFDDANKGMPSITCPDALNNLSQGLVQVVPGLGIPPKQAFLQVKGGFGVKGILNSHRK